MSDLVLTRGAGAAAPAPQPTSSRQNPPVVAAAPRCATRRPDRLLARAVAARWASLGWPGIILPEEYGGLGLGYAELVGRARAARARCSRRSRSSRRCCSPATRSCSAASAAQKTGAPAARSRAATRSSRFAHHEPRARHRAAPRRDRARARRRRGGYRAHAVSRTWCSTAHAAERLVVSARSRRRAPTIATGIALFLVDPRAPGRRRVDAPAAGRSPHARRWCGSTASRSPPTPRSARSARAPTLLERVLDRAHRRPVRRDARRHGARRSRRRSPT